MKVSILIPCYNAERWIDAAIRTALGQTHADKEVIVIDDGSTDGSLEIIRKYDRQIQWQTGPNEGGNHARNRLLKLASGEWLQYLDADDYLSVTKVARQLRHLESHQDADVIYSPVILEYWDKSAKRVTHVETQDVHVSDDPWTLLVRWRLPQTGGPLWRKSMVEAVSGWNESQPCCQEADLYLRLLQHGANFSYCDEVGAVYRQWSQNTVCTKNPLLSIAKRLEIIDATEAHLLATGQQTTEQAIAIAVTRMELARSVYQLDPMVAHAVERQARLQLPARKLPKAAAFPPAYRVAYRLLGFGGAEWLAKTARRRSRTDKPHPSAS